MTKLLALTDLHLREPGKTIIGLDPFERAKAALDHAVTHHPDAARIIVMGDLAHSGKPAEYARAAALFDGCPLPVTLMAGNHDQRDLMCDALPWVARDANGFLQTAVETDTHLVLTLDTLHGPPYVSFAHYGDYCILRRGWLQEQLNRAEKPVIVFTHHPPHTVGLAGMDQIRMRDDDGLADILINSGKVQHLFAGHVHRTISGCWRGLSYSMFKSTCHQSPLALHDPELTLSTDEPGAYGVILLDPSGVTAHTEDHALAKPPQPSHDALPEA